MNAQWLIYRALGLKNNFVLESIPKQHCGVCGVEIEKGIHIKKVVSGTFTNFDIIKNNYICEACANLMKGDIATKLRRSSFIATENEIIFFRNKELARYLFQPPDPPFVFCYTTSFKKHNAFRAVLNNSRDSFVITWEDRKIEFNREEAKKIFRVLIRLYVEGFTRTELLTGNLAFHKLSKFPQAFVLYELVKPYLRTGLLELLVNAIPAGIKNVKRRFKKNERTSSVKSSRAKSSKISLFDLEEH